MPVLQKEIGQRNSLMEGQKDLNWPPWFQEYAFQDLICAFNLSEVAYQKKNSLLSWGAFMKKPCFSIFTPTHLPPHRAFILYTAFVYTVFPPTISALHLPHYYIVFSCYCMTSLSTHCSTPLFLCTLTLFHVYTRCQKNMVFHPNPACHLFL